MEIGTIWIIVAAFVILLEIWAIWHIIGSDRRAERKMLWIVFVVYAPFPGLLFWAWRGASGGEGQGGTAGKMTVRGIRRGAPDAIAVHLGRMSKRMADPSPSTIRQP